MISYGAEGFEVSNLLSNVQQNSNNSKRERRVKHCNTLFKKKKIVNIIISRSLKNKFIQISKDMKESSKERKTSPLLIGMMYIGVYRYVTVHWMYTYHVYIWLQRASEDEMAEWHHQYNGHELGQASGDGEDQGGPGVLQSMGSQRVRHDWATEQQLTLQ